jgi:hypothetical protein
VAELCALPAPSGGAGTHDDEDVDEHEDEADMEPSSPYDDSWMKDSDTVLVHMVGCRAWGLGFRV